MAEPRVAVVTGAAAGIGQATAEHLAALGDTVLGVDVDPDGLAALRERVGAGGGRVGTLTADLADPAAAATVVETCLRRYGRIDVLALVAGVGQAGPSDAVTVAEWDRVLDVNLRAPFLLAQAAMPHLVATGGTVVAVSSVAGLHGWSGSAVYAASKGGLIALMRSLAAEYGPAGVRINVLCPGAVRTRLADGMRAALAGGDPARPPGGAAAGPAPARPPGRRAEPAEIARTIAFLASPDASFVAGSVLRADGGALA